MKPIHHKKSSKNKIILLALIVVSIVSVLYAFYASNSSLWPFPQPEPQEVNRPTSKNDEAIKEAGNTNQATSDNSIPDSSVSDMKGEGLQDTGGGSITSDSGIITLYSPGKDERVSNSTLVSGTAKTTSVSYRIKDTERGVIGQGQLTVNAGKFSGQLTIHSSTDTGTFEIFTLDGEGREINSIKIPVRFNT